MSVISYKKGNGTTLISRQFRTQNKSHSTCRLNCSRDLTQTVFILSMPCKVIIILIEFMFLGINMFWALLRAHFNPRLAARAKDIFILFY